MIRVLTCDRCHNDYAPYTPDSTDQLNLQIIDESGYGEDQDLCPECYKKLLLWWNE